MNTMLASASCVPCLECRKAATKAGAVSTGGRLGRLISALKFCWAGRPWIADTGAAANAAQLGRPCSSKLRDARKSQISSNRTVTAGSPVLDPSGIPGIPTHGAHLPGERRNTRSGLPVISPAIVDKDRRRRKIRGVTRVTGCSYTPSSDHLSDLQQCGIQSSAV